MHNKRLCSQLFSSINWYIISFCRRLYSLPKHNTKLKTNLKIDFQIPISYQTICRNSFAFHLISTTQPSVKQYVNTRTPLLIAKQLKSSAQNWRHTPFPLNKKNKTKFSQNNNQLIIWETPHKDVLNARPLNYEQTVRNGDDFCALWMICNKNRFQPSRHTTLQWIE